MRRLRWYSVANVSRATLTRLLQGMRREEFDDDSTLGFMVEKTRPDSLEAQFVERFERAEILVDPFGESREFQRTEYEISRFRLSVDFPELEFHDCPRSVSPAINCLSSLGETFIVQALEVDLEKWIFSLEKLLRDIRVTTLHLGQLSLSESATAKIVLRGSDDVRRFAKEMAAGRPYKFDRLDVSALYDGIAVRLELRSDARATISLDDEDFLSAVRHSFVESI